MAEKETKIIEVNGVKLEVDLRTAKKVENFKVGDPVKVLKKEYSDSWKSYYGVIIDFTQFQKRPAIEVLYVKDEYSNADIKFVTITKDTKEIEIAPVNELETQLHRADIIEKMDRKINKAEENVREIKVKKQAFIKYFGKPAKEVEDAS